VAEGSGRGVAQALVIRALGPGDAPQFREVRVRSLREHPEAFARSPDEVDDVAVTAEHFRRDAVGDSDFMLGAFAADVLAGIAGCHRERAAKQRHVAYVWGVYVTPEHRGTGVGRRLVEAVIERARTWPGLEALWLDVNTTNRGARALYASCGFVTAATKPRILKVGDRYYDEELMILDLRAE
jgi:ribosomal protein S18 acetylase RimI-like enzyme